MDQESHPTPAFAAMFWSDKIVEEQKVRIISHEPGLSVLHYEDADRPQSLQYGSTGSGNCRDWTLCNLANGKVAIRSACSGKYVSATDDLAEGNTLSVTAPSIGPKENFKLIRNEDGSSSFQTYFGTFWKARVTWYSSSKESGPVGPEKEIKTWERFRLELL